MPWQRKTLTQLRSDILSDINSARITGMNGDVLSALLQKAILRYIAYAQAGVGYQHYSELDYIAKQAVPWTATDEFLEGWASLKGVTRKSAASTTGTSTYPYLSNAGENIPAGTSIVRSDGLAYVTTATVTPSGSAVTLPQRAVVTGAVGNFDPNTVFTLGSQFAGVLSQSTASGQVTPGVNVESDDSLRTRMLQVYAAPPQGGSAQDYLEWALAVSGITRAWVIPNGQGAGTTVVFFMMDLAEVAHGGFPQGSNGVAANEPRDVAATGDQLTLANSLFPLRPTAALVYAAAALPTATNFTIADLGANNTTAMLAAMTSALTDMFLRLGNVGGSVQPDTGAPWPPIEPDAWYAALEAIPGLSGFKVTLPTAAITPAAGYLPTLGTITPVT